MKTILLNTVRSTSPDYKKYEALIDDNDYEVLSQYRWSLFRCDKNLYAFTRINNKGFLMHKMLTGFKQTDHIDGNGLNNQRSNLRKATRSQNLMNARKRTNTSSKFKGVCWHKKANKWTAYIGYRGKLVHLGLFGSEQEASQEYNRYAKKYFKEFAKLNQPN